LATQEGRLHVTSQAFGTKMRHIIGHHCLWYMQTFVVHKKLGCGDQVSVPYVVYVLGMCVHMNIFKKLWQSISADSVVTIAWSPHSIGVSAIHILDSLPYYVETRPNCLLPFASR